jgi:hypothetical protein
MVKFRKPESAMAALEDEDKDYLELIPDLSQT